MWRNEGKNQLIHWLFIGLRTIICLLLIHKHGRANAATSLAINLGLCQRPDWCVWRPQSNTKDWNFIISIFSSEFCLFVWTQDYLFGRQNHIFSAPRSCLNCEIETLSAHFNPLVYRIRWLVLLKITELRKKVCKCLDGH